MKILAGFRQGKLKKAIPWFKALNHVDYEMTFKFTTKNKLLDRALTQSLNTLKKDKKLKGKNLDIDINKIKKFEIPVKFYNVFNTFMRGEIRKWKRYFKKDNIVIVTNSMKSGFYERTSSEEWLITIIIGGEYVDKRE